MQLCNTFLLIVVAFVIASVCIPGSSAVRVDRVHLDTETEWVPPAPVFLMCEVTLDTDEEVVSVTWLHEGDPVYRWLNNGTVFANGVLYDRVDYFNRSSWNIKIIRIHMDQEGEFSCIPQTNLKTNDSGSFQFIINYMPVNIPRHFVNEDMCTTHGGATLSRVHPKPMAMCYMTYTFSQFKLKLNVTDISYKNDDGTYYYSFDTAVNITDYEHGSVMWCYTYVYGVTVDLLTWPPNEEGSCPVIDTPPPPQEGYNLTAQTQTPGCRHGIKANSSYEYTCSVDQSVTVNYTCSPSGVWGPDLIHDSWPTCATKGKGTRNILSWTLILFSFVTTNYGNSY